MVNIELYEKLLNNSLSLDHFFVLKSLYYNEELPKNKRVQGFLNLLIKRGYIEDGILTEIAIDLVQEFTPEVTTSIEVEEKKEKQVTEFSAWVRDVRLKCQDRIFKLKGTKQVRDRIKGKAYSFLPNETDLAKNLLKVIKLYRITDYQLVERKLLEYIEQCNRDNNWFPILYYYIFKDGKSQLVTDMENDDISEVSNEVNTLKPTDYGTEG
jgi:hypothetical protein